MPRQLVPVVVLRSLLSYVWTRISLGNATKAKQLELELDRLSPEQRWVGK
jgi:hypothetical protein